MLWISLLLLSEIDGFRREFSLTDTSIQHTYAVHERVPMWALILICLVPLAFYATIGLKLMRSFWVSSSTKWNEWKLKFLQLQDFHAAFLGNVLSLALTSTTTTIIKVMVGRPRPGKRYRFRHGEIWLSLSTLCDVDLIDRCQPMSGITNQIPYGLVTSVICTSTDTYRLREGFRSFPSGHASCASESSGLGAKLLNLPKKVAWSGLGFFALFLAGKLHLFDRRGHTVKAWIVLIPVLGASTITVTRTMDYRHHATEWVIMLLC